jgi:hypothetical protein
MGWNFVKPLPEQTLKATIAAWNHVAPKAIGHLNRAFNFSAEAINKGFNTLSDILGVPDFEFDFDEFLIEQVSESDEYEKVYRKI